MDIPEYLTEEVVVDYADALITRREALRRLVLMGVDAAAASLLLAACGRDEDAPTRESPRAASPGETGSPSPSPVATEEIEFTGPNGALKAAWAEAAEPRGSVLVIHENRGLNDHFRSVASRLASQNYSALAIDLLSEEGGTAAVGDEAKAMAALSQAPPQRFVADMRAGIGELERRTPGEKVAAIGFCFGGGRVWDLLAAGEPRLAAAVPFYGPAPENADFSRSKAAVLAIYGELDQRINATRDAAEAALKKAGLTHEVVTYPGADHAFFNDTGQRYNREAATKAYQKMLDWFRQHLA